MADISVGPGEISSGIFQLSAGQVSTVTFSEIPGLLEIISDGASETYYTVDNTTPSLDGKRTYLLPQGMKSVDERGCQSRTVRFISAGTPTIRVQKV